jgi:predicted ABC-type ATPase
MKKALFIFAGANGSGKTTLYKQNKEVFGDLLFVNADEMLKEVTGSSDPTNAKFGQDLANQAIENCFAKEESFCFETVFSHISKIDLIKRAKLLGYTVSLYFTHLSDPVQNLARVKRRLELGGHDVPEDKILSRIPRTLENVKAALSFVDDFYVFDNDYINGHQLVAYKKPLSPIKINLDAPSWARALVKIGSEKNEIKNKGGTVTQIRQSLTPKKRYKTCVRCGRFLRGKTRPHYGVCSICEPKIKG